MEPRMTVNLTDPIFSNEDAARAHFEAIRWPNGPVCPHCGVVNQATLVQGKSHRAGMYQCNACREPFTVKVGTVMEASHISYAKWALGFHLVAASKKGMSAHQLHRMLGVTYKTAWFMEHRIREAMRDASPSPLGGPGKIVEGDEAYVGGKPRPHTGDKRKAKKTAVIVLVERNGRARAKPVAHVDIKTLHENVRQNVRKGSDIVTDEYFGYRDIEKVVDGMHFTVRHSDKEYAKEDIHSNTAESFFALLKRGVYGTFHHVSKEHLPRYVDEFEFRWNRRKTDDTKRSADAIKGIEGKRLTYRQPRSV